MSKKALGRGIEALLKLEDTKPGSSGVLEVEIGALVAAEGQPRKTFREETLLELAESIRQRGILQPILVEEAEPGRYRIVAGERRFRAAGLAGLSRVPVLVQSFSEQDKLEIALIENIQREDLPALEEAAAYKHLMSVAGLSQEELARRVGKKRSTVANALRLLKLPEPMQEAMNRGELTPGHARAILSLEHPADQQALFEHILAEGSSVREAEARAARLAMERRSPEPAAAGRKPASGPGDGEPAARPGERRDPELAAMEEKLIERLGTKVVLRGDSRRGRIEIEYYSLEDLERIYSILQPEPEERG